MDRDARAGRCEAEPARALQGLWHKCYASQKVLPRTQKHLLLHLSKTLIQADKAYLKTLKPEAAGCMCPWGSTSLRPEWLQAQGD